MTHPDGDIGWSLQIISDPAYTGVVVSIMIGDVQFWSLWVFTPLDLKKIITSMYLSVGNKWTSSLFIIAEQAQLASPKYAILIHTRFAYSGLYLECYKDSTRYAELAS